MFDVFLGPVLRWCGIFANLRFLTLRCKFLGLSVSRLAPCSAVFSTLARSRFFCHFIWRLPSFFVILQKKAAAVHLAAMSLCLRSTSAWKLGPREAASRPLLAAHPKVKLSPAPAISYLRQGPSRSIRHEAMWLPRPLVPPRGRGWSRGSFWGRPNRAW